MSLHSGFFPIYLFVLLFSFNAVYEYRFFFLFIFFLSNCYDIVIFSFVKPFKNEAKLDRWVNHMRHWKERLLVLFSFNDDSDFPLTFSHFYAHTKHWNIHLALKLTQLV